MNRLFTSLLLILLLNRALIAQIPDQLPVWTDQLNRNTEVDWLIKSPGTKAEIYRSADSKEITLYNGLLKRTFQITTNVACIDFRNLSNGQQLLRAVKPEARVTLDGHSFDVGGLKGQKENAYLVPAWVDDFKAGATDFVFKGLSVTPISPFVQWKSKTWSYNKKQGTGKMLSFSFESPLPEHKGITIKVNYELFDELPLIVKWVSITNTAKKSFTIDRVVNEVLGLVEEESAVVGTPEQMKKQHGIYVETNYAFNNAMRYDISDQTTHWKVDSAYTSQVNYFYGTPCLLEVYPEKAPGIVLKPGEVFKSVRTHELLMDSYDRERRGLAIRRMYSTVAPWTTQNPIFMHLVSKNDDEVKTAIAQCAATGYEALILSFGSHCNIEDSSKANIERWKNMAALAHSKGILIGSYSLFSSRRISDEDDVIDPDDRQTGRCILRKRALLR